MTKINSLIDKYESGAFVSKDELVGMQRELACEMYHLTTLNVEAFGRWNSIVYKYKGSNAGAKVYADLKVPELRDSRKILEACKGVAIAINSELKHIEND